MRNAGVGPSGLTPVACLRADREPGQSQEIGQATDGLREPALAAIDALGVEPAIDDEPPPR